VSQEVANAGPEDELPHVLAFYLPQFHQVPDNDAWHGSGFTEWTVVARAEPLFPGHHQPHLPGELGFYDLRVPETRERQANLARRHGISGFLYYHYWFRGRRMLERPFDEVLRSGGPDFPFALCWANESWYRRWQGSSDEMLVEQDYDAEDDLAHIRWLIEAFKDPRYITVHGRPLLTIYRPDLLPEPKVTFDLWREECANAGVREPWLVMFETGRYGGDPAHLGFDASGEFVPHGMAEMVEPVDHLPGDDASHYVYSYDEVATAYQQRPPSEWTRYPCVASGWDNTPRRRRGEAVILHGSNPDSYGRWLDEAVRGESRTNGGDGIVFVNAWNEWAEGAHLEPDTRQGRAFLEKTREVVEGVRGAPLTGSDGNQESDRAATSIQDLYVDLYDRFVALQAAASGLLAHSDRRLAAMRDHYEEELRLARDESHRLVTASLRIEEQLALVTARYERSARSPERAAHPGREGRPN
jgi:hypothetical protein